MTTGERLVNISTLSTATAIEHFMNISVGNAEVIYTCLPVEVYVKNTEPVKVVVEETEDLKVIANFIPQPRVVVEQVEQPIVLIEEDESVIIE